MSGLPPASASILPSKGLAQCFEEVKKALVERERPMKFALKLDESRLGGVFREYVKACDSDSTLHGKGILKNIFKVLAATGNNETATKIREYVQQLDFFNDARNEQLKSHIFDLANAKLDPKFDLQVYYDRLFSTMVRSIELIMGSVKESRPPEKCLTKVDVAAKGMSSQSSASCSAASSLPSLPMPIGRPFNDSIKSSGKWRQLVSESKFKAAYQLLYQNMKIEEADRVYECTDGLSSEKFFLFIKFTDVIVKQMLAGSSAHISIKGADKEGVLFLQNLAINFASHDQLFRQIFVGKEITPLISFFEDFMIALASQIALFDREPPLNFDTGHYQLVIDALGSLQTLIRQVRLYDLESFTDEKARLFIGKSGAYFGREFSAKKALSFFDFLHFMEEKANQVRMELSYVPQFKNLSALAGAEAASEVSESEGKVVKKKKKKKNKKETPHDSNKGGASSASAATLQAAELESEEEANQPNLDQEEIDLSSLPKSATAATGAAERATKASDTNLGKDEEKESKKESAPSTPKIRAASSSASADILPERLSFTELLQQYIVGKDSFAELQTHVERFSEVLTQVDDSGCSCLMNAISSCIGSDEAKVERVIKLIDLLFKQPEHQQFFLTQVAQDTSTILAVALKSRQLRIIQRIFEAMKELPQEILQAQITQIKGEDFNLFDLLSTHLIMKQGQAKSEAQMPQIKETIYEAIRLFVVAFEVNTRERLIVLLQNNPALNKKAPNQQYAPFFKEILNFCSTPEKFQEFLTSTLKFKQKVGIVPDEQPSLSASASAADLSVSLPRQMEYPENHLGQNYTDLFAAVEVLLTDGRYDEAIGKLREKLKIEGAKATLDNCRAHLYLVEAFCNKRDANLAQEALKAISSKIKEVDDEELPKNFHYLNGLVSNLCRAMSSHDALRPTKPKVASDRKLLMEKALNSQRAFDRSNKGASAEGLPHSKSVTSSSLTSELFDQNQYELEKAESLEFVNLERTAEYMVAQCIAPVPPLQRKAAVESLSNLQSINSSAPVSGPNPETKSEPIEANRMVSRLTNDNTAVDRLNCKCEELVDKQLRSFFTEVIVQSSLTTANEQALRTAKNYLYHSDSAASFEGEKFKNYYLAILTLSEMNEPMTRDEQFDKYLQLVDACSFLGYDYKARQILQKLAQSVAKVNDQSVISLWQDKSYRLKQTLKNRNEEKLKKRNNDNLQRLSEVKRLLSLSDFTKANGLLKWVQEPLSPLERCLKSIYSAKLSLSSGFPDNAKQILIHCISSVNGLNDPVVSAEWALTLDHVSRVQNYVTGLSAQLNAMQGHKGDLLASREEAEMGSAAGHQLISVSNQALDAVSTHLPEVCSKGAAAVLAVSQGALSSLGNSLGHGDGKLSSAQQKDGQNEIPKDEPKRSSTPKTSLADQVEQPANSSQPTVASIVQPVGAALSSASSSIPPKENSSQLAAAAVPQNRVGQWYSLLVNPKPVTAAPPPNENSSQLAAAAVPQNRVGQWYSLLVNPKPVTAAPPPNENSGKDSVAAAPRIRERSWRKLPKDEPVRPTPSFASSSIPSNGDSNNLSVAAAPQKDQSPPKFMDTLHPHYGYKTNQNDRTRSDHASAAARTPHGLSWAEQVEKEEEEAEITRKAAEKPANSSEPSNGNSGKQAGENSTKEEALLLELTALDPVLQKNLLLGEGKIHGLNVLDWAISEQKPTIIQTIGEAFQALNPENLQKLLTLRNGEPFNIFDQFLHKKGEIFPVVSEASPIAMEIINLFIQAFGNKALKEINSRLGSIEYPPAGISAKSNRTSYHFNKFFTWLSKFCMSGTSEGLMGLIEKSRSERDSSGSSGPAISSTARSRAFNNRSVRDEQGRNGLLEANSFSMRPEFYKLRTLITEFLEGDEDLSKISTVVEGKPTLIKQIDEQGFTFLAQAIYDGVEAEKTIELIDYLFRDSSDREFLLTHIQPGGYNILMHIVRSRHPQVVQRIVDELKSLGPETFKKLLASNPTSVKRTVLQYAIRTKHWDKTIHLEIIRMIWNLLEELADPEILIEQLSAETSQEENLLMLAFSSENPRAVRLIGELCQGGGQTATLKEMLTKRTSKNENVFSKLCTHKCLGPAVIETVRLFIEIFGDSAPEELNNFLNPNIGLNPSESLVLDPYTKQLFQDLEKLCISHEGLQSFLAKYSDGKAAEASRISSYSWTGQRR